MTRPDRAAIAGAVIGAAFTGGCLFMGWKIPAAIFGALGAAAVITWWRPGEDSGDIEALVRATREKIPDHVPDEWTEEFRQ